MSLISINNLSKFIVKKNSTQKILNNINLCINEGEFIAILGESGAGKTTLLNIIAGLDSCTKGEYLFNNSEIHKFTEKQLSNFRNNKIGIIFQNFYLINHYTVLKNIKLPIEYNKGEKNNSDNLDILLKDLNIENLKNEKVKNLSGGEKQRVAICRALINNPGIIIADEPTGSLDSQNSKNILDIFKKLNKIGKTIIIVTHDINVAKYCSRIITMRDGYIISDKSKVEV